uniref:Anillin domain-containing protein n=1 Tax=Syphacia muris TaxID=451379 RepID=A0A158R5I0_9BILA
MLVYCNGTSWTPCLQDLKNLVRRAQQLDFHLYAEKNALVECKKRRVMAEINNFSSIIVRNRSKKLKPSYSEGTPTISNRCLPSRARLGISHLSIPLAWNSDEHFGSKGDGRMYSMFVVLQTKTEIIDSRIVTMIDKTCTDVVFPDSFIFENQPSNFEIDLSLYSAKTSGNDMGHSLKQKLARSLSRKIGASFKSSLNNEDLYYDMQMACGDTFGGSSFRLLGKTVLRIGDAKPRTGIYDLQISPNAESFGPPLYGHICCRLVAQPNSVVLPISDGILSIRSIQDDRLYSNMQCRLQGGSLRCSFTSAKSEQTALRINLSQNSSVQSTNKPKCLMLSVDKNKSNHSYLIMADTEESVALWKHAFELQIMDCTYWKEFAVLSVKLTSESRTIESPSTYRTSGRRLYDEIQINGNLPNRSTGDFLANYSTCSPHRNIPEPSTIVSFSAANKLNQTAPSGRRRNRTPLQNLFKNSLPAPEVTNTPVRSQDSPTKSESFKENAVKSCRETVSEKPHRRGFQHSDSSVSQDSGRFKGLKKSWQRSFGALLNRKQCEISHF